MLKHLEKNLSLIQGANKCDDLGLYPATSHPFERLTPIPDNGNGLNPLLKDPGLAFHPPLLYGGYVGFLLCLLWLVRLYGKNGCKTGRLVHILCLIAWSSLTVYWPWYVVGLL